jgi:hypothetical protein
MMAPEFECDAISEHAQFGEGMNRWKAYLTSILGLAKNDEGDLVPYPNATKSSYDAKKVRKCIEEISEPLLVHVSQPYGEASTVTNRLTATS